MARIINVIRQPHLVTFKAYDTSDYRCCGVCDYKVFIETDEGNIIVASVMDDDDMRDFDIDEAVRKLADEQQNEDWFYAYNRAIGKEDIDRFVNGQIEQNDRPVESFCDVVRTLRQSRCRISESGMKALRSLADELNKTIEAASKQDI